MMIRFMKSRVFVALLLTAAFVGSYNLAGNFLTAEACQFNNCSNGCHLYTHMGELPAGGTRICQKMLPGQHWDTPVVHVGATVPGGVWAAGGPMIRKEAWEDCCFRCLGNNPITQRQETMTHVNYLVFITTSKHLCTSSGSQYADL